MKIVKVPDRLMTRHAYAELSANNLDVSQSGCTDNFTTLFPISNHQVLVLRKGIQSPR